MADADVLAYFSGTTISTDLFRIFCGEVIGSGSARTVYACTIRPDLVVKVETPAESFQNILEWEFWKTWSHDKVMRKWLAPCEAISSCGTVLLQYRTQPVTKLPDRMPQWLTDTKRSNYGRFRGRIVCHDYGMVVAGASPIMRKVIWRDE